MTQAQTLHYGLVSRWWAEVAPPSAASLLRLGPRLAAALRPLPSAGKFNLDGASYASRRPTGDDDFVVFIARK